MEAVCTTSPQFFHVSNQGVAGDPLWQFATNHAVTSDYCDKGVSECMIGCHEVQPCRIGFSDRQTMDVDDLANRALSSVTRRFVKRRRHDALVVEWRDLLSVYVPEMVIITSSHLLTRLFCSI